VLEQRLQRDRLADPHDAVPEPDVAVVEDEVAIWGPVADVSDHRVVSLGRTVERQLVRKPSGLSTLLRSLNVSLSGS
jgi:hypothetical protein